MVDVATLARRTCVVIPALNESLRIREVVEGALAECPNVLVIDDGSDDGTSERIADLPITLLRHEQRQGKGASLREGFAEALRRGFDGVLTMDGDGQHLAEDIPRLLDAAARHPGALIIGCIADARTSSATGASRGPAGSASPTPRAASAITRPRRARWATYRAKISCSKPRC